MAQIVTIEVTNVSRYRNICIGNATSGVRGLIRYEYFHGFCGFTPNARDTRLKAFLH